MHPLKTFRENRSITQSELATLLQVSRTTVARWEIGERKIDKDKLGFIAAQTGISPKELRPDLAALMHEAAE